MMLHSKAFSSGVSRAGRERCLVTCRAQSEQHGISRRSLMQQASILTAASAFLCAAPTHAASPGTQMISPKNEGRVLCDAECLEALEAAEMVTLPSGLQYKDIRVGKGECPPVGYQVVVNYVAMTPNGRAFENSLERGSPYDIRVGAGQVIPGLDEGLLTMRPGGIRRLYIPGSLSFPKGLKAAPGRPSVPPSSPVVFDVQLLYVPGFETEDDDEE